MTRRSSTGTSARFEPGDRVRVRPDGSPGHVRTPGYVRGHTGRVSRVMGSFRNPEDLAYGGSGLPEVPLYRVDFRQMDLWPDYVGQPEDTLEADVFEHWLQPEGGTS